MAAYSPAEELRNFHGGVFRVVAAHEVRFTFGHVKAACGWLPRRWEVRKMMKLMAMGTSRIQPRAQALAPHRGA